MAKFLNKKEQVFDLKLTSYGNYRLSQGNFKPVYYAFYDDNILYDIQYASGKNGDGDFVISPQELQNDTQRRIKDETQYLESFVLFEEVENQATTMTEQLRENQIVATWYDPGNPNPVLFTESQYLSWKSWYDVIDNLVDPMDNARTTLEKEARRASLGTVSEFQGGRFAADYNPTQEEPRKDFFKFNSMIGDAHLDGDTQAAPAWKIITLQGQISSSATEDLKNRVKIPQINIDLKYVKEINDFDFANVADPESIQQLAASTQQFKDKKVISLKLDDVVVYAEELNTELLTENFEIEVFEVGEYTGVQATGSLEFTSGEIPSDGDNIIINDGINSQTIAFKTTATGSTEVAINTNSAKTARSFESVFNSLFALTMTCEVVGNPNDSNSATRIVFRNNQYGPSYNIPLSASNTATPAAAPSSLTIQGLDGGVDGNNVLKRKFFEKQIPQVKNGMMLSERPKETDVATLTPASVEYYFDILTDYNINQTIACKGAEIYNKESYYIDLDFDCDQNAQDFVYNDIYGYVTEPEVCLD